MRLVAWAGTQWRWLKGIQVISLEPVEARVQMARRNERLWFGGQVDVVRQSRKSFAQFVGNFRPRDYLSIRLGRSGLSV